MGVYHIVKEGEHVVRIAAAYGGMPWRTIWNAPENAELRRTRDSPDVLMPGDSLYIPDRDTKELSAGTDRRHSYRVAVTSVKLSVKLLDRFKGALANQNCCFDIGGDSEDLTTDGQGLIERTLSLPQQKTEQASVTVQQKIKPNDQTLTRIVRIPLKIGHMDPVTEVVGQIKRLRNLGYYPSPGDDPDPLQFKAAVEEFQCENGLVVDGDCGPQTQARLKQAYGC